MKRDIIVCVSEGCPTQELHDLFKKFGKVWMVDNFSTFEAAYVRCDGECYVFAYTQSKAKSISSPFLIRAHKEYSVDASYLVTRSFDRISFEFTPITGIERKPGCVSTLKLDRVVSLRDVFPETPGSNPYTGKHVDWSDERNYQCPAPAPPGPTPTLRPSVAYHYLIKTT
jgi:hypothetical protein